MENDVMERLRRKMDERLLRWRKDPNRLPLIIKGARQIGKTEAIEYFAKQNYENVIEINFILQKEYRTIFDDGYDVDQINRTMTVGELIDFLAQYDEDTPIYLSFDNGYTYGGITEGRFEENYGEDNDDE